MDYYVVSWPAVGVGVGALAVGCCGFWSGRYLWALSTAEVFQRHRWEAGMPLTGRWLRRFAASALFLGSFCAALLGVYFVYFGFFGIQVRR